MSNKENFFSLIYSHAHRLINSLAARPMPFNLMFARFREFMEHHDRAIDIIADMGDKLGGDYLFDIVYVRRAYSHLYDTVTESLSSFDVLTQNKYPRLKDVLVFIDKEIRLHVFEDRAPGRELVLAYSELTRDMGPEAGGKNVNLAELKNNTELSVPEAFVITSSAYNDFMTYNGIDAMLLALHEGDYREIYDAIIHGDVPPALEGAIDEALGVFRKRVGGQYSLAVRSSAEGEDGEFSFAGQFETELNVPLDKKAVLDAYKRVIASLFSDKATTYYRQVGSDIRGLKMAVGCMIMVDAAASGVIYSTNPGGDDGTMIINAAWGLGASVVESKTDTDFYQVRKGPVPVITNKRSGKKTSMVTSLEQGGVGVTDVPASMVENNAISDGQAQELSRQAMDIENYFRQPQDIEWAIDKEGKIFILQARPLRIASSVERQESSAEKKQISDALRSTLDARREVLMTVEGQAVQRGVGGGRVFVFKHKDRMDNFSKGNVLVATNDSSDFIRFMPYASAIITDTGSLTSHMASLCREFRVPAFVNAGNATQTLKNGQEVTVVIDDEATMTVYDGILGELIGNARSGQAAMENIFEFRRKRYLLRFITPLNLIDPLIDRFLPETCKTLHDILRFTHEKAVMELIDNAVRGLRGQASKKLDLPIPAGIIVVDIGGGLDNSVADRGRNESVSFGQILSVPFKAVLQGMMHPGAWQSSPVALRANDFMASMMRMPDIASGNARYPGSNIAVISQDYLNMNLKFGYHFSTLDCYCSEKVRSNHIYFRFTGGATDIVKRSRRIELISIILKEYGFNIQSRGDLIVGRLANITRVEQVSKLDQIGRLISYTRQLDALLHDDSKVELYARRFLAGNYEL